MTKNPADRINAVSPSFCLAKWLQVTIDLVNGTTHSCHHPKRHVVPKDELEKNPGALHNTSYKKEQRKRMLEGVRPPECGYCWEMEDSGSAYSDRIIKSTDSWAIDRLDSVRSMPWDADVVPSYVEVMLDDLCNFSCAYCIADVSTSIAHEIRHFGPIPKIDVSVEHRIGHHANSPRDETYIEAFWKWLPAILPELRVLRVTGGEPLLSRRLDRLFDFVSEKKNPALTLVINSHLTHEAPRIDRLIARASELLASSSIGKFELYTSMDAHGERAEYQRHGLNYGKWLANVEKIARSIPGVEVVVMSTFTILSLSSFPDLLRDILKLKRAGLNVVIDASYLRDPAYLRADMATSELLPRLRESIEFMRSAPEFSQHEIEKMENIAKWVTRPTLGEFVDKCRRNFFYFTKEFDRRKNKEFVKAFPEYRDFYVTCKQKVFESIALPNSDNG